MLIAAKAAMNAIIIFFLMILLPYQSVIIMPSSQRS